ncbi:MAG: hypothetical protein KME19_01685 [Microcoleus vaginatus WJT46-NPBG5]|nr:hypothetical protein [Microcoleus vaginatus WJT46-NPBG5]
MVESLALSREAQSRLSLSPAEGNRLSRTPQQFLLRMPVGFAGLRDCQEMIISITHHSVKPASDLQLPIVEASSWWKRFLVTCCNLRTHPDSTPRLLLANPTQLIARWHQVRRGLNLSG